MADDLVELGLEGADKLIDKHFHKIPDKALHSDTYKPHRFRKDSQDSHNDSRERDQQHPHHHHSRDREQRRDSVWEAQEAAAEEGRYPHSRRQQDHQPSKSQWDNEWDHRRDNRQTRSPSPLRSNMAQQYTTSSGRPHSAIYAQDGPAVAAPWTDYPDYHGPATGRANASQQFSPRESTLKPASRVDAYSPATHRPSQPRRRSSSYHGPRDRNRFYSSSEDSDDEDSDYRRRQSDHRSRNSQQGSQQLARREGGNGSAAAYARSERTNKSKSHSDHDFKDKIQDNLKDNFTDSKQGLAGSALGALVGGFVAHKALESRGGRDQGNREKALTLLGAVVGGVAVNAVVDKLEDRKTEQTERRKKGKEIRDDRERHGGRRDGRDEDRRDDRRARSERGERRERSNYH